MEMPSKPKILKTGCSSIAQSIAASSTMISFAKSNYSPRRLLLEALVLIDTLRVDLVGRIVPLFNSRKKGE